jgi:glutamine phosphoribosylpyrophosphate amidotransferase
MAQSSGAVNTTELIAALINTQTDLIEGIQYAQEQIDGSLTLLIMRDTGELIAARDPWGRLPVLIGKDDDGYCVTFESFAYGKLGYVDEYELGPGQQLIADTGYVAYMSATCSIDVVTVKGMKNIVLGGEGLFNTVITGPGKVALQSMPIAKVAQALAPFTVSGK